MSSDDTLPTVNDSPAAPIVFFEAVASTANRSGIVRLVLVAERQIPRSDGGMDVDFIVIGHLRRSMQSAKNLPDCLNDAILLGTPTEGQTN